MTCRTPSRVAEPLGYLDLAALASQARVIVTDSGGLQKEAYWYGVPCVTPRPSTEWVDTVELGANVLVDADPDALVAAVATRACRRDLPQLYGDGHASERIARRSSMLSRGVKETHDDRRRGRASATGARTWRATSTTSGRCAGSATPTRRRATRFAARYPHARMTADLDDLLADPELDAVVIATPVPTHYPLAKRALEAGKHVMVEKPPAMHGDEMEELVAIAEERDLTLMPGHLLLYHPGVRKLKELIDSGELGDVLCVYGNRQNLGIVRSNENALWSLGVHDLSVILYLIDEDPVEAVAHGRDFLTEGVEDVVFCYLRFPSGKIAHMHLSWLDPHKMRRLTVVGDHKMAVFDDMELERKVTVYEKAPWKRAETYGEWQTRSGDIYIPKIPTDEPLRLECSRVPAASSGARATGARSRTTARWSCARSSG